MPLNLLFVNTAGGDNVKLWRMTDTDIPSSPSLLRRLAAMLYDTFLIVALVAVVNAIALAVLVRVTSGEQEVLNAHLVQFLTAFSIVGFFSLFWLKSGQTLGMQAWRIQLVNFQGAPPSVSQAIVRCCGALLSAACLGLGYLWCLVDRKKRYWHDYLSRTELVLLPKASRTNSA